MKPVKTLHSRHQHGNKHAGIYGTKKDICPTPKGTVYFHMGLPQLLVSRLLEMYPNMSAYKAVKQFLLDNIPPTQEM
jgi:hypothetical protein